MLSFYANGWHICDSSTSNRGVRSTLKNWTGMFIKCWKNYKYVKGIVIFSVKHLSISLCVYQVNETLVRCISYVVYEVLCSILSAKRYKHLLKRKFRKLIRQSWYYLKIIIIPSFNSSFSSHNQTKLSNQILTLNSSCERLKEICYKYCFHDFSFSTHTHTHTLRYLSQTFATNRPMKSIPRFFIIHSKWKNSIPIPIAFRYYSDCIYRRERFFHRC